MSAGEAAIAQLERDLTAAQMKLAQAEAKATAAQEDAAEKDKVIKCVYTSHCHVAAVASHTDVGNNTCLAWVCWYTSC